MSIIITGSEGYIGTVLKKVLDNHGVPYVGFDRKINYDLLSPEGQAEFEHFSKGASSVIHLAARPRVPQSWTDTTEYVRDNIELTEYVARVCAEQGCHLIFAGSSSIYGDGTGPLNPYAWTKQAGEDIIRLYGRNRLHYTICRIFTTYGNNGSLVLDTWLRQHLSGNPITLHGDGTQSRDFIHVEDVAHALYSCYLAKLDNKTLDIGTGNTNKLIDLANLYSAKILREPPRLGDTYKSQANASQTKKLLDWSPAYSVENWILTNLGS